jgi:ubiquinone/menaquinone biosynthesis C-methylase UbiE
MNTNLDTTSREQAQLQWNTNPCGNVEGDENTLAYFEEVERERYKQQNWQHEYFDFEGFKGKKILEIGVGHGTDNLQFAKGGAICHAIDITQKHMDLAKCNFELRGYDIEIKLSDATQIAYPDNYFDCVYSFGVLHHIPEMEKCIAEVQRVLKPGGTFYMALYHKWSLFHLVYKIIVRGIFKGDFFKIGYDGILATIEKGADGKTIKPYVKLYTKAEVNDLLAHGWDVKDISVWQLESSHISYFAKLIPQFLAQKLNKKKSFWGWYVVSTAKKKV